jgi:hypothetical protein
MLLDFEMESFSFGLRICITHQEDCKYFEIITNRGKLDRFYDGRRVKSLAA